MKTSRIALINPPLPKSGYRHQIYLPIGLPYLAAVLEASGHDVKVLDCAALEIDHEELRAKLSSLEPNVVGITAVAHTIMSAILSARMLKEACPNATVVLGGPHATFMDEEILRGNSDVDVVVRGEGEETMLDLVRCVSAGGLKNLHEVAGITFRKGQRIVRTRDRPLIQDLDQLPYPAYKYFPLSKYRVSGRLIFPIITSRGCPYQCTFCVASQMFGKAFRARSIRNVVDELEWLRDEYSADAFTFYDDTFTLDLERALKICEEIKNREIGLPWNCQTRVDHVSEKVLAKMREAGCELVYFGVESGSQKILDAMKKGTTVEQNEKAIKLAKEAGLIVVISAIVGYPGETEETLKQTINFIKKTEPDDAFLCIATPYPGTELYNLVKENDWKMLPDWSLYDTTTPVFENPSISKGKIMEMREKFYNEFYSPIYILRHILKGKFYNRFFARIALSHLIWRIRSGLRGAYCTF
jgi:radical SAM superfamily enzyme YgiQ (UPF0313 family)